MVFACRLVEKAYKLQHRVFVNAQSTGQAQQLDELLWTFRDGSFVPHELQGSGQPSGIAPVLIGDNERGPDVDMDLIVNLAQEVPPFLERFERAAEVVDSDPTRRTAARERFRYYREQDHDLQSHKLTHP